MRLRQIMIGLLICAGGFLFAILIGTFSLVILECETVPVAMRRKYENDTVFHVLSAQQLLLEDGVVICVLQDAIKMLRDKEESSYDASITSLESLCSRLRRDYERERSDLGNALASNRMYAFCNNKKCGYVLMNWVEDVAGTVVEDKMESENPKLPESSD